MEKAKTPKYLLLKQEILMWIQSGKVKEDEKLPTEHEIADRFNYSRHTVRQTLGELEKEGWLYKVQGRGTFVSKPIVKEDKGFRTIGIMTTYISDYIFPHIVRGAEEVLSKRGYRLVLSSTDNNKEKERAQLEMLNNQPLDGLIIEPTKSAQGNPNLGYYLSLKKHGIPILMINEKYSEMSCPQIKVDDEAGGFLAAEHLIKLGHRNIVGVFKTDDLQGVNRLRGFIRAHDEYKVEIQPEYVVTFDTESKESIPFDTVSSLIANKLDRPTAIVCYNDELAIKLFEVVRQAGYVIPEDISVVGFDDAPIATATEVKLTTIMHPKYDMGVKAAEMLLQMIMDPGEEKDKDYIYEPKLIVRQSTKEIGEQPIAENNVISN